MKPTIYRRKVYSKWFNTFLFFVVAISYAQGQQFEIFGGPAKVSRYGTSFLKDYSVIKIGYTVGIGFNMPVVRNHLDIGVRGMFEQKGTRASDTRPTAPPPYYFGYYVYFPPLPTQYIWDITQKYYTFSVMPRYWWGKRKRLSIGIGPYYSIVKSSDYIQTLKQQGHVVASMKDDYSSFVTKNDWGISFAVSYPLGQTQWFNIYIQLMDNYGLYASENSRGPSKNNSLSLGILFSDRFVCTEKLAKH